MKRLCSIIMVLLLCLAMAVPVFAAESQEYIFEIMPPVSMLNEYEFLPEDGYSGLYEGVVPEGTYNFMFSWNGIDHLAQSPVYVDYSYNADYEFETSIFYVSCIFDGITLNFEVHLLNCYDAAGISIVLIFASENFSSVASPDFVKLASVKETTLPAGKFADLINADTLATSLDCLISLLPVVLAVIVGYIGLRKAIAWLMSVMRSS